MYNSHQQQQTSYFEKVPTTTAGGGGGVIWELLLRACESRQERRLKLLSWSYKLKKSPDSLVRARLSASTEDFWLNNISWGPATLALARGAFSNIYYRVDTTWRESTDLFFFSWTETLCHVFLSKKLVKKHSCQWPNTSEGNNGLTKRWLNCFGSQRSSEKLR